MAQDFLFGPIQYSIQYVYFDNTQTMKTKVSILNNIVRAQHCVQATQMMPLNILRQ